MIRSAKNVIRVANIIEEGNLGGPQVRILRLADALKGKVETTVLLPRENSQEICQLLNQKGIRYQSFSLSHITRNRKIALRYVICSGFEIFKIYSYVKKESFDIVHVSGGAWQYKGLIAGKLAGHTVIWHLNDTRLPTIFRWVFRALSDVPDYYIFSSERTKQYYVPLIRRKKTLGAVVRQPVDTEVFSLDAVVPGVALLRERWEGNFVIGTIANINPIKGLELFLNVAHRLNGKLKNLQFIVVGPVHKNQERYFHRLLKLVKELGVHNIDFPGRVSDTRGYLTIFDVFLCTSVSESGPLTLWEAMSMQRAVVTTDVGDVRKYVCSGKSGEVLGINDDLGMSEKIAELYHDSERRKRYGEEARKVITRNFDSVKCADKQLAVYRRLADSSTEMKSTTPDL